MKDIVKFGFVSIGKLLLFPVVAPLAFVVLITSHAVLDVIESYERYKERKA